MKRTGILLLLALAAALGLWQLFRPGSGSLPPGSGPRKNVLLVTIDTLRADRVGRGLTPAIDGLASRGVRYSGVRATAPMTLPSHVSLMTGTLPTVHGVRENGVVFDGKQKTLARTFKDAGYRTGAFVGAYVLNRRFGLADGFDTYDDAVRRDAARAERLEAERPGSDVVDAALAWLTGKPAPSIQSSANIQSSAFSLQPFFLWVHLYDPHAPYEPPAEYLQQAGGNAYDGEVAYADAQVARLLDALTSAGLADSTVVAVTGDHGEGLGEHGEQTHGMLAYDSTLRVPLIVASPAGRAQQVDEPMSLASLALLLRDVLGPTVAPAPAALYSETVYPRRAGWHALSALADERWKLIRSSDTELYEIATDPSEQRNVAASHPNVVQAMTASLQKLTAGVTDVATVSPEAAERLRALGYVSGAAAIRSDDPSAANPARVIGAWGEFEQALTQLQSGKAGEAVPVLRRLVEQHPGAPVFHSTYAQALKDSGDPRAALRVYQAAAAKWPTDPGLFHDLAVAARDAGDPVEAARAEAAALALDGTSAMALNGLGLLHADAGRHTDAAAAFERAATLDPTNASYWSNLGNARSAAGDSGGAEQAYNAALAADARYADALNGLGMLRVQSGRAAEAVPFFERALAADAGLHEARLNLGIALQESGQRERAADVYREILNTTPPRYTRERNAAAALLKTLK